MDKIKVLHLLQSNRFSGAENVACQIIEMFRENSNIEMCYCSSDGPIRDTVQRKNITFFPLQKMNIKEVRRVLKSYKPDIIHAHDMLASFIVAIASCGMNCQVISHIHNSDFVSRKISHKSLAYYMVSRKYKNIIWVSNSCFKDYYFHKFLGKKSCVLYNIVNSQYIWKKANETFDHHYDLVYVGRLAEPKNPQRLIRIVKKVSELRPDISVAIVGSGVLENEVRQLISDLNLDDNISLLGFMDNPLKVVKNSEILVMTSDREGTPMAALEAMALFKPIISTPTDGLCDLVEPGLTGFLDSEEQTFADHIVSILTDEVLRRNMSLNIQKKFEKQNDIEAYRKRLIELYGL